MTVKRSARTAQPASTSRGFDRELAELEELAVALREASALDAAQIEFLRGTLGNRNNFLVSKAARIVADHALAALLPEVLAAYGRFFEDAAKTDPKCWAKDALAKALVKLEFQESAPYVRGMRHHQLEGTWGGSSDTAGALRGTCTHALVACHGLGNAELLDLLLEPLVDTDKTVRMEAARAIGYVGGASAGLLLKLRVLLRQEEPEVMGAAFSALLEMDGAKAIPLVAGFLDDPEEIAAEAGFALAATHAPEALAALVARRRKGADAWFGAALDNAIALTRLPEAVDFLIQSIKRDERQSATALEAISRVYSGEEIRLRVKAAVTDAGSGRLEALFREYFPG
jgi:HEAT repeat protein